MTLTQTPDTRAQKITELQASLAEGHPFGSEGENLVESIISDLNRGQIRVCEKVGAEWKTNAWVKQAILFYFRLRQSTLMEIGEFSFYDKIPVKKWTGDEGVRVVPPAIARYGSFIASGAILMPSYVNIGAYVDAGSMVDTWATVGSCAQVGKNVHLSGGVGLGGVLEPVQASPVIIEDDAFIGSRCIIVEGVLIEQGAVLGAGVTLTASTKIVDVTGDEEKIWKGRVPANAVVIPGTIPKSFPAGVYGTPCALLIGYRTASTDKKTSLNSVLREFQISV